MTEVKKHSLGQEIWLRSRNMAEVKKHSLGQVKKYG